MDCCAPQPHQYDLVIIGSGSASFAAAIRAAELGRQVAMIERATLGGTCVNVGCVPSKTLIRAAESRFRAEHSPFKGIELRGAEVDFATLIREKDSLVDSLRQAKYAKVLQSLDKVELIDGEASFISRSEVRVGDRILIGKCFLIATGASAWTPPVPGLSKTGFLTSTTLFELKTLPASLAIIGGRSIALEVAQMMQRLGSRVTILQRSEHILPAEDNDLSEALTGYLAKEGVTVLTGVRVQKVSRDGTFHIDCKVQGEARHLEVEQLLVAAGRRPNTSGLGLEKIGVELNQDGAIKTNEYGQTTVATIYSAGDVSGDPAFVYTAAYEGKLAVDNGFGARRVRDITPLPYVIFTDPQVARIGLNEQMAREQELAVEVVQLSLENVPRALAARDTRGFIKLLKQKGGDQLLGASILAPEGSELLMEIALAIRYKIPVQELAGMLHPYLTLGEGIKLAAQAFDKDVKQLSCCAT